MRVGVNCFLLRADIGGLKQYFFTLFDWLLENDFQNEYTFFLFPPNLEQMNHLRSDRWRERAVYLGDQNEIAGHLSKLDLYFCPFNALWPRPAPLPAVFTLVDIQERFYPRFFTPQELYNRDYHYVASTHLADRVLTISEFSKSSIEKFHRVPSSRILVAYLCADPRYGNADQAADPPAEPLPFDNYLLFPANRWLHKNHDVLLRALKVLREQGSPANLVITGYDIPGGYPVAEKAGQYGVRDMVFTAGYVTVPQMLYLYRHAEMLVFPSLFEGFGMPPVEAMAAGCPVAASNATCLPEICKDAAEYFDPADPASVARAITRIRSDANLRAALVEKGLTRARVFSPERMAQVHLQAFGEACKAYSPARRTQRRAYEIFNRRRALARLTLRQMAGGRRRSPNRIRFVDGWHQAEGDSSGPLRWTSGRGVIEIVVAGAGEIVITGEFASIARPNTLRILFNRTETASLRIEREFGFQPFDEVRVKCGKGRHRLEFVSAEAGVSTPADSRVLAVAIRNLQIAADSGRVSFEIAG